MKIKYLKAALAAFVLSFSVTANAGLIDHGTSFTDDTTGLEWRDVFLTSAESYNSINNGDGGYLAAGWSIATLAQLCDLYDEAGSGDTQCLDGATNVYSTGITAAYASQLKLLFGDSFSGNGVAGMFDSGSLIPDARAGLSCVLTSAICFGGTTSGPAASRHLRWATHDVEFNIWHLVRSSSSTPSIPEPSTLTIFALGMIGLVSRRFKIKF